MPTVYTEVEVDVDLNDFDTDDLIEELESRGAGSTDFGDGKDVSAAKMWKVSEDYEHEELADF